MFTAHLKCAALLFLCLSGSLLSAEDQWALSGPSEGAHGTDVKRLHESDLLKKPEHAFIVAVIDSGFDFDHEDLQGIWLQNDKEAAGTEGVDDDNNGYVDDIQGWNFVGGKDGKNVIQSRLELVREIQRMEKLAADTVLDEKQQAYLSSLKDKLIDQRAERSGEAMQPYLMLALWKQSRLLAEQKGIDPQNLEAISEMPVTGAEEWLAREALIMFCKNEYTEEAIREGVQSSAQDFMVHFDKNFSESAIIGDDPADMKTIGYGNPDLSSTNDHGTSVVSLIAALSDNDLGISGQCPSGFVKILPLRAVPDGDERDKDIANALRYAVDQGARVVNMSFGKYYSPNKDYVDAAFAYALEKGVLIVIAAGNDGTDVGKTISYPNAWPLDPETHHYPASFPNVLVVGASTNQADRSLTARWSNYSKTRVHIFAPGADVMVANPDNDYDLSDGTSLAAPVATGVVALLWSQFPDKTWQEIHQAIMKGARPYPDQGTFKPGTRQKTKLSELCISGGIVDAWRSYHYLKDGALPE